MEDALVPTTANEVEKQVKVLILVLMEDALVRFNPENKTTIYFIVLILVLMEDALVPFQ